jgi:hypothetical protein
MGMDTIGHSFVKESRRLRQRWFVLAGLAFLCLLVYSNSFYEKFQYDDVRLIRFNFSLRDLSDWRPILRFEPYRPLLLSTFALNYQIGKEDPFSYHVINLVIHYSVVVLFFLLLMRHSGGLLFPAVAAAIMSVHPLNTESVTYIASRSILLCSLFYFAALLVFDSYIRTPRGYLVLLYVLFLLAGILTKEEAAALPLATLLYNYVFFGKQSVKKHKIFHSVTIGLVSLLAIFRIIFEFSRTKPPNAPLVYFVTEVNVWLRYLWLAIYPVSLNVDHDVPPLTIYSWVFWVSLIAIAGLFLACWKLSRRNSMMAFWSVWFFLNLLPSFIFPLNDFMAEHRVYLSMFGFCALYAYLLMLFQERGKASRLITGALLFQILIFGWIAFQRNRVWSSEISLWRDSVQKSPLKLRPRLNLAGALLRDYWFDEATSQYLYARSLRPDSEGAYNGLGFCYLNKGRLDLAERNFRIALRINPGYVDSQTGLGIVLYQSKNCQQALPLLAGVYPQRQESTDLIRMLSECYIQVGDYNAAMDFLSRGAKLEPQNEYWKTKLERLRTLQPANE